MIHEVNQVIWVNTPHGVGIAMFIIDYGPQNNTMWVVSLKNNGEIKHYDSSQIRVERNYTLDFNLDNN